VPQIKEQRPAIEGEHLAHFRVLERPVEKLHSVDIAPGSTV